MWGKTVDQGVSLGRQATLSLAGEPGGHPLKCSLVSEGRSAPAGCSLGFAPLLISSNKWSSLFPFPLGVYSISVCFLQASQLGVYRAFVDNYEVAMEMAEKCCQANAQFAEISEVTFQCSDTRCAFIWLMHSDKAQGISLQHWPFRLQGVCAEPSVFHPVALNGGQDLTLPSDAATSERPSPYGKTGEPQMVT